ncbi:MAG: TonB-dependent receptor [Brevundimonas sp.]|uniref:TonB-dependent receptor n=1 Tax=Brevundimonas sp. TaxID=1871086 RepID=UPI0025C3A3B8|nr:TonB-dependent receptor [Brevundimonas sp.]MBX3477731.1 TonB-dependent receptor [Brevundimonas sp.]
MRNPYLATASLVGLLSAAAAPVAAQTAPADPQASSEAIRVDEVVVTAQRRSQRLQDVPLSVSALAGEVLESGRVQSVEDFQGRVPTLVYSEHNASDPQIRVRGIGSDFDGASLERSVAVFVDDVYLGRAAGGTTDLFDLDRVEVLRGPQGTLYGKNTVGGAINFISARPTHSPYGRASVTVGNYGTMEGRVVASGPLSDTVAGRISVAARHHDGYNTNLNTGNKIDDLSSVAIRGSLSIDLSEDLKLLLSADGYQREGAGASRHAINIGNAAFGAAAGPDARHNYMVTDGRQDNRTGGLSARLEWSREWGQLTSITAYRATESDISLDLGGNRFSRVPGAVSAPFGNSNAIDEASRQFSQELRLSNTIGSLSYVAGLFYFKEEVDRVEETVIFSLANPVDQVNIQDAHSTAASYAAFADVSYRFSPQWELSVGLRWSQDRKTYDAVISGNRFPGLPWTADVSRTWDELTPRVALSYHISTDHMIYGTVSRGFKSGGWDGQPTSLAAVNIPVDPEYVTNYEIGFKTAWWDRRAVVNASAFYMDYTDLQIFTLTTPPGQLVPVSALINAGSAVNAGVEVEATFRLTQDTTLGFNYGYLDTEITEDVMVGAINVNGNQFSRAPKHTLGANLDHTVYLGDNLEMGLHAGYRYTSEYFYNVENAAAAYVPESSIWDASVDFSSPASDWKVSVWGKNLTDEEVPIHIIPSANTGFARFAPPRTFGVTLSWTY